MRIAVVLPAHNEAEHLRTCLRSFVQQSRQPDQLIIVNDNSTDQTQSIAQEFAAEHTFIELIEHQSSAEHQPGAKVIQAFNKGKEHLKACDLLGKFDADLILPSDYFQKMEELFKKEKRLGLSGGLLFVQKGTDWVYENIAKKDHVRGPIKLYRKEALEAIGGLAQCRGWDSVDRWQIEFAGFTTKTLQDLQVKHLRPTGAGYTAQRISEKGKVLGRMRFDPLLGALACLKTARQSSSNPLSFLSLFGKMYAGYWKGFFGSDHLVTRAQGHFIRGQRWKGVWQALTSKQH